MLDVLSSPATPALNLPPYRGRASYAPPAVLASKGLAGILDRDHVAHSYLDLGQMPPNMVLLNVYNVGDSELLQSINKAATVNDTVLVGGVFHGGIEVYGHEWSYGATKGNDSGVGAVRPRMHPQHTYKTTVPMGTTSLSKEDVKRVLLRLSREWLGHEYNLIHRNCLTFCNALLQELGLRRIPGWVDRAARAASSIDKAAQFVRSMSTEEVQGQATEVLDKIKNDSVKAIDVACTESAKLVAIAQSQALPLFEAKALEIGGIAQERLQAELGTLGDKVLDFRERAQEQVEVLRANIWPWAQDSTWPPRLAAGLGYVDPDPPCIHGGRFARATQDIVTTVQAPSPPARGVPAPSPRAADTVDLLSGDVISPPAVVADTDLLTGEIRSEEAAGANIEDKDRATWVAVDLLA